MKKLILVCILLTGLFFAQNRPRPGIDYIPQIGFFDFVVVGYDPMDTDGRSPTSIQNEVVHKG